MLASTTTTNGELRLVPGRLPVVAMVAAVLFAVLACSPPAPVRIGFLAGLSGRVADLGIGGRNGAILAVEMRNRQGGINGRPVELIAEAPDWYSYDLPQDVAKKAWRGGYRGQTQKWFALRFTGHESEIDIHDPGPGHKPEFDAWRWEDVSRLPELIIPFKRQVYENVVAAFAPLIGK